MLAQGSRKLVLLGSFSLGLLGLALAGPSVLRSLGSDPAPALSEWQVAEGVVRPGTYDWAAGALIDPGLAEDASAALTTVYHNSCATSGLLWWAVSPCEILFDQGVIPGTTNPNAGLGATDTNQVSEFTFAYCTNHPGDDVEIEILFWEGEDLISGGPLPAPSTALSSYRLTGLKGLVPGETFSCHAVTVDLTSAPFCMISDGDGSWENSPATDPFTWGFISHTGAADTGPIIGGDPAFGPMGDCTYSNPCFGCGTGLKTPNLFWTDEYATGCPGPGITPGAKWFGGTPWASFQFEVKSSGACSSCGVPPDNYCASGMSASGCQALISATGTPSATAATGFTLDTTGVEGNKDGLYFFGTNGRQANAWGSGTSFQCVAPPVKRAGLLSGNGTSGTCDGVFSQDMNARWSAKPAQNPGPGAVVQAQLWYRDPFNTSNQTTSLSDAIEFVMCP